MGETLLRLKPAQELILDKLLEVGIFKTRSEAIRAGILGLGKEYGVFKSVKELEDALVANKMQKISGEIKQGKRKLFSRGQVKKKYGFR